MDFGQRGVNAVGAAKASSWTTAVLCAVFYVAAVALSWLIPPMQSPDETSHITRAYLISTGQMLLDPPAPEMRALVSRYAGIKEVPGFIERLFQHGGRTGGAVDLGLLDYVDAYRAMPGDPPRRLSDEEAAHVAQIAWRGTHTYYVMPGTGYYFPAIYAPQALGLLAGRVLGLSVDHSYRAARAITLLCSAWLLWAAFRLATPNPLVAAVLLLPMSVFQMLSPTVDGLTTALAVACISLFLSMLARPAAPGWKPSCALAAGIFLLATTRTHLVVLLALPLFLAWRWRSRPNLLLGCLATVCALAWTLFALKTANDVLVPRSTTASALLAHYARHPLELARIVGASISDPDLLAFYRRSFIGILGALDVPLPDSAYFWLSCGLAACALAAVSIPASQRDVQARAVLLTAALGATLLIFFALLVTWTPYPAQRVGGVQGRYFVVPAILLAYALSGLPSATPRWQRSLNLALVAGFGCLALAALTSTLAHRYH